MSNDIDLEYLRSRLQECTFYPYLWDGEDQNLRAFRSKEEFIAWYCQPPGVDGQPYRDRGFYTRELAMLSRVVQPRRIIEFGTSLGIGTCLLRWLNPEAELVTVDINSVTYLPGDQCVPVGYLAIYQKIAGRMVLEHSWEYLDANVDLCFIDADHSYKAVISDSDRAWRNMSTHNRRPWAIAWHDHNDRHPGVMAAVAEFCAAKGVQLQSRLDSDTVWVWKLTSGEG